MKILGIIPARYESTRFPGKPLADIAGKPMIQHVYERCMQTKTLTKIIVATDNQLIYDSVKYFGGEVCMTSTKHLNGTSRCAEVLEHLCHSELVEESEYDFVINIQGDEPLINPNQIDELAKLFEDANAQIITQVKKETDLSLLENPNIVKAIFDENQYATDFVRIPNSKIIATDFYKHIGIYGFKTNVLQQIVQLAPTENELRLHLEQLRWLDNGYKIKIGITEHESISVDTLDDLEKVRKLIL
ncbi:MAG TPA: 3-deoxy-manno-octulosonate cytidylyltransferase [Chitinophagales bacterium]|nr:3-deoxy-manno-octulosonate cytidylyltransferase [Chitinophagales bacterium]